MVLLGVVARSALYLSVVLGLALFIVPIGAVTFSMIQTMSADPGPARMVLRRDISVPLPPDRPLQMPTFGGAQQIVAVAPVESSISPGPSSNKLFSVVSGVNVRSAPAKGSDVLLTLQEGDAVSVLETKGGWSKVAKNSVVLGWVYERYLTPQSN